MRVIVLGAGGRLGSRVLAAAAQAGHDVTAYVRSAQRLRAAVGEELLQKVQVVEGDAEDRAQLAEAMRGQEAAVQTAGYIGESYEEAQQLQRLVQAVTQAASEALVGPRRLWVLGGAGALDLPGRGLMMVDVPGFPFTKYLIHKENYEFLKRPEFDSLDWTLACPGSMLDAPRQQPAPPPARVTADELPATLPCWAGLLPNAALLPAVAALRPQLVGPSYEEVAGAIVAHLAPAGPLRHRRVGFASAA